MRGGGGNNLSMHLHLLGVLYDGRYSPPVSESLRRAVYRAFFVGDREGGGGGVWGWRWGCMGVGVGCVGGVSGWALPHDDSDGDTRTITTTATSHPRK